MTTHQYLRFGMIDIGSNSIRLVIYEKVDEAGYRIIDESKQSARLSERITHEGILPDEHINELVEILTRFRLLCTAHQVTNLRAVATAAIRNAFNTEHIVDRVQALTGITIDVLSGAEEARMGFLGVMNTMCETDGFLIDIGGGSTEVTLVKNRSILHSVSFPFGAVNMTKVFSSQGVMSEEQVHQMEQMIEISVSKEKWISSSPGLPCIGVGGTFRTIAKLDQHVTDYSLSLTHHYELTESNARNVYSKLFPLDPEKRKKIYGVSKDRADLIIPGMLIALTLIRIIKGTHFVISGNGLRDGLFFDHVMGFHEPINDVIEKNTRNLLEMHPEVSKVHVEHVNLLALRLYDEMISMHGHGERVRKLLSAASLLYRIGVGIQFHEYYKHTYYLIAYSRLGGLSHRETLIVALTAAYKSKVRVREFFNLHRDILSENDLTLISQLGSILRMAIAFDRSETQPIQNVKITRVNKEMIIKLSVLREPVLERLEWNNVDKEFQKVWGVKLKISTE